MRRLAILCFLASCAGLAFPAAAEEWRLTAEYDILLASYSIEPATIRLKAGEPVRLRFVNNSNQRHGFVAGEFFRAAKIRGRDAEQLAGGSLQVAALSTRTIALVPKAGRYRTRCSNQLHRLLGMRGRIIVD